MNAPGLVEAQMMLDAGFEPKEVSDWSFQQKKSMMDAGFSRAEVDTHFGTPPFAVEPIAKHFDDNLQAYIRESAAEGAKPKPITSFTEALEAGLQMSIGGLVTRGKAPDRVITEDTNALDRVAANVTTLAADLPVFGAGYLIGGANPITGTAGAFALPAGIRKILMDKYEKGEVTNFADFWDRLSGAVIDTAKAYVTGAATGAAGKVVGMAPIASPAAKTAAVLGAEITTMVTVGKALEGEIPTAQDFMDTAIVLGFVKAGIHGAKATNYGVKKLRGIYAETGVRPQDLAQDILRDPTINQDLASDNIHNPKAYTGGIPPPEIPPVLKTEPVGEPPTDPVKLAQDAILSKISVGGKDVKEPLTFEKMYTAVVDDLNPIREAVKAAAKETVESPGTGELKTKDDPYQLARLTRGTFGKADMFLERSTFDFTTYQNNGEPLKTILEPLKDDLNGLRAYGASRRDAELTGRGIETGLDHEAAKQVVAAGAKQYEPIFRKLVDYQNRLSKYLLDSGVISQKVYDHMLELNEQFIPFFRVMDDGAMGGAWLGKGVTTKNPIKAIKGNKSDIVDPIESVIKNTYTYLALAERNVVGRKYVEMANKSGRPEDFIVKVKPEIRPVTLTEPEIRKMFDEFLTMTKDTSKARSESQTVTGAEGKPGEPITKQTEMIVARVKEALTARGFQPGEADQMIKRVGQAESGKAGATVEKIIKEVETTTYVPELDIRLPNEAATIFRAVKTPLADNEIAVFDKGKRTVYEVDPEVAKAFKSADQETANLLMRILAVPARTLRAGAVLSPEFIARNFARDQLSAFVFSKNGYLPVFDFVSGLTSFASRDAHFENWLKGGGANSALVSMDRQYLQEHLFKLSQDTGLMSRAINVAKSPLEMLRVTSELVENSTRLGEFKRAVGEPTKGNIQSAAFQSREVTLDFARIGAKARAVNMISAFFSAQVNGVDRLARAIIEEPVSTLTKLGVSITLPSVLLWWANHEDPRYKELPQWQKDLFWIVMTKDVIYRIPKPFEAGIVFGTIPERALDAYYAQNPDAFKNLTQTILDAFLPNPVPTAAAPIIEQFSNRSMFTGNPIIPSRMEKLMPEYQYTEYTTETTKAVGALISAFPGMTETALSGKNEGTVIGGTARALTTPVLIDNYIRSWTGGLGQHVVNAVDAGLRAAKVVPDPVLPARTLADIPFIKAFVVRYPSAGTESIQKFYDEYYAKEKVNATFMVGAKSGDIPMKNRAQGYDETAIGDRAKAIRSILTQEGAIIRGLYKNPKIPKEEKRQLIDQSYFVMIQLAQEGRRILGTAPAQTQEAAP